MCSEAVYAVHCSGTNRTIAPPLSSTGSRIRISGPTPCTVSFGAPSETEKSAKGRSFAAGPRALKKSSARKVSAAGLPHGRTRAAISHVSSSCSPNCKNHSGSPRVHHRLSGGMRSIRSSRSKARRKTGENPVSASFHAPSGESGIILKAEKSASRGVSSVRGQTAASGSGGAVSRAAGKGTIRSRNAPPLSK